MSAENTLLYVGAAALVVFGVAALSRRNVTTAAKPASTGVLGVSPILSPSAPKTTGDFARFDRAQGGVPVSETAPRPAYHDPVYDPPPTRVGYHDPVYGDNEVPDVRPDYTEPVYSSPL